MLSRFSRKNVVDLGAVSASRAIVPYAAFMSEDKFLSLKVRLHQKLIDELNLSAIEKMPRAEFENEVGDIIRDMLSKETTLLNERERKQMVTEILDELLGLGPLEPLLKDNSVSDVIVNTHA
jgi:pilus assembly protein CpaF